MSDDLKSLIVKFPKGTVVFTEGEEGSEMFFIHSGKVRIDKKVDQNVEILGVMEKGDFFGEMAVLDQLPRTATAIVEEDAELLRVDATNFEKILKTNIEIAIRMIRKYAARLRESNERLETILRDRREMSTGIQEIIQQVKKPPVFEPTTQKALARFEGDGHGVSFDVLKESITIGRRDPVTGITPEIDLTESDPGRSVSRRHARLTLVDKQFLLLEEIGVSNGTFVEGVKIQPGEPIPLKDGAKVSFGHVRFIFSSGSTT